MRRYAGIPSGAGISYAAFLQSCFADAITPRYIASSSWAMNWTCPGPHDRLLARNWDGFVAKLSPTDAALSYATYLGGSGEEEIRGIDLDMAGNAYVTGWTYSGDFPVTPTSFNAARGDSKDAFVAKLDTNGSNIVYGGYVGGLLDEEGRAIAVDNAGNAYAAGWTKSEDFTTSSGAFQTAYNGYDDVFAVKVSSDGRSLAYATLLGGTGKDRAHGIQVDTLGNAYVTGETKSADFPHTPGAFATNQIAVMTSLPPS